MELTGTNKRLYKDREYRKLFDRLIRQGDEGIALWNRLIAEDEALMRWYCGLQKETFAAIFADPAMEVATRQWFADQGLESVFNMHKSLHEFGFVTGEELAAAFGCTSEEVAAGMAKMPDKYKVRIPEA